MKKNIILGLKIYLFVVIVGFMLGGIIDAMAFIDGNTMPHDYLTAVGAVHVLILLVLGLLGFARLIFGKSVFEN